jgi:hypothetical protein
MAEEAVFAVLNGGIGRFTLAAVAADVNYYGKTVEAWIAAVRTNLEGLERHAKDVGL